MSERSAAANPQRIGVLALGRPTFDVELAESLRVQALAALAATGVRVAGGERLLFDTTAAETALAEVRAFAPDLLLVLQLTFTDASMTVRAAREVEAPLAIWAMPEPRLGARLRLNGLCGLNLAAHALGRAGKDCGYLYAAPDAPATPGALRELLAGGRRPAAQPPGHSLQVSAAARAEGERVARRLAGARIGVVGEHPAGFDTCSYDPFAVREVFGTEVARFDLQGVFARAREVPAARVAQTREAVTAALEGVDELDPVALDKSLALHGALSDLQREQNLSGLAVRCWPETFTEYGGAACGPMAMLNEQRVPCACEADVLGNLTTLALQEIAGTPALMADLVDVDAEAGTAVVWHCGLAPLSMADPEVAPAATIHSNRKLPLLHEFALKPGRITLARVSQSHNRLKLVIGGAQMLRAPPAFSGTSGVLRFDAPAGQVLESVIGNALEHHYSFAYGDHREALVALADRLGLPVLQFA